MRGHFNPGGEKYTVLLIFSTLSVGGCWGHSVRPKLNSKDKGQISKPNEYTYTFKSNLSCMFLFARVIAILGELFHWAHWTSFANIFRKQVVDLSEAEFPWDEIAISKKKNQISNVYHHNQVFGGAKNRDMSLIETCFYWQLYSITIELCI